MKVYIDGAFVPETEAKISVFDHGLLYGDGVFEGIRAYNGRVFKLEEHIDRLFDSAKAILLQIPLSKPEVSAAVVETLRVNGLREGYVRLVVTRGVGNLGLSPTRCKKPSLFIIASTLELYPERCYREGLKVITASTQRMSPAALNPAIKSLNYLNNVLAKIEGLQAGAEEVLMLNAQGFVAECSGDNVFAIKNGVIFTPPVYAGALGGITRRVIFDLAADAGHPLREVQLTRYDLYVADEIFLTGTGAEVIPVVDLDGRPIGDGTPGPISRGMIDAFRQLTSSTGTPIFA
ncbi:MAG: branched-chain-amino-acid transaminase [Candidatus Methylacidiphilales bacterium]